MKIKELALHFEYHRVLVTLEDHRVTLVTVEDKRVSVVTLERS